MSSPDAGTLATTLLRLGLVANHQIEEAWEELGTRKPAADDFLKCLERKGYLSPFQSGKVLKGDTEGYFLGGYRILYKIASGSFGRVYRADDPGTGRVLAIKVLRQRWSDIKKDKLNKHKIDLFMREAKIGMSLRHPNIVEIIAVNQDVDSNQYYIVMEFVEGGNLRDFLAIRKKLPVADVLRILEDAASGLAHAFSKGITHRDMKLTNILLSSQGPAKLVDFGLAGGEVAGLDKMERGNKGNEEITVDRTVDYAGLEKATGVPHGDSRSDIFFLGCVGYELLSGRSPMELSRSAQARMSPARFQKIIPLKPAEVEASVSVFRLIENMMALDAEKRVQTPAQLVERVRACRKELEPADTAAAAKGANQQATIFLAESDEKLQDVLRTKLKAEGFRILLAADPVRALDRFRQQPFELLIVDASTTGENGYYVFERIMEDAQRQNIPCRGILMLGADQGEWKARAESYPGAATLTQPIKYKQLLQTIRSLLAGDR